MLMALHINSHKSRLTKRQFCKTILTRNPLVKIGSQGPVVVEDERLVPQSESVLDSTLITVRWRFHLKANAVQM